MDPQLKSILTSVLGYGAAAAAAWAVTKGYVTPDQQGTLTTALVTVASSIVGGLLIWYKARMVSPPAMTKALNDAPNGVKVVSSIGPGSPVNLKPDGTTTPATAN